MKRVMLTGGGGFVAGNIITQSAPGIEIHAVEAREVSFFRDNLSWYTVDLLDTPALERLFARIRPDVVVHAAALSDIDFCEAHQDHAARVNVGVTRVLAELCRAANSRMIYFSSDSVFDGETGNYSEADEPNPLNAYARTKLQAESIVSQTLRDWVIVRPSLVLGLPAFATGNSFLWRMVQSLRAGNTVAFPGEEIRSPIDVLTLSRAILELAEQDYKGYLHLSGNDALSRLIMARRIARRLGYDETAVVDRMPGVEGGRARRPRDVSLSNRRAREILGTPFHGFGEELDLALKGVKTS
jgi:dTDP-4-dehydrorhamnose reductase